MLRLRALIGEERFARARTTRSAQQQQDTAARHTRHCNIRRPRSRALLHPGYPVSPRRRPTRALNRALLRSTRDGVGRVTGIPRFGHARCAHVSNHAPERTLTSFLNARSTSNPLPFPRPGHVADHRAL